MCYQCFCEALTRKRTASAISLKNNLMYDIPVLCEHCYWPEFKCGVLQQAIQPPPHVRSIVFS